MPKLPRADWPSIPTDDSLTVLQAYQQFICEARGWDQASDLQTFLLFTEEVGELAKGIRKRINLYQEQGAKVSKDDLPGEFADVLSYLLELANRFDVDLFRAYIEKEEINRQRDWT